MSKQSPLISKQYYQQTQKPILPQAELQLIAQYKAREIKEALPLSSNLQYLVKLYIQAPF